MSDGTRPPTVSSLFSVAGMFDLGFQRAGFTISAQVEIDMTARDVLARHWPDMPRFPAPRDVFTPEELAARLAWHAERVARERPPELVRPLCDACGMQAPCGNAGLRNTRWMVRRVWPKNRETYCPECFAQWGWPEPQTEGE